MAETAPPVVTETETGPPGQDSFSLKETLQTLGRLLLAYRGAATALVAVGVLSSLAEGVGVSLFIPFLQSLSGEASLGTGGAWISRALGSLFQGVPPESRLLVIALCILGVTVLKSGLGYGYGALFGWLDARIGHRLRSGVFQQLLTVGYGFIEKNDHGELLNTLATDTWRTGDALRTLLSGFITLVTALLYVALLLLISWPLTLVVSAALLGISLLVQTQRRRVKRLGEEVQRANVGLTTRMVEGLGAAELVRTFGREEHEQGRFDHASDRVSGSVFRLGLVSGAVGPIYEVLTATLLVAVLVVGVRDTGDLAALLVFIFVLYRLQPKVQSLDGIRLSLDSLAPSVGAVAALMDPEGKPYVRSGSVPWEGLQEGVRFEDVSFRYDPTWDPALDRVTVTIPAGKTTAFVGRSGAGKSTLIKLLVRLYDPTGGVVTADGVPLSDLDLAAWRGRIAFVSQDAHVFNATVRQNIAYGRLDATDAEVASAAKRADAHGFITALADGYDTEIGERGTRLSGGQRQRLALARAIVRDPDLLILDEATNALDTFSEHLIQEALDVLRRDRTVVVIAHRLSTVEEADHIVVMDGGRVAEQGTLQELLALDGLFAELYRLQYRSVLN